MSEPSTPPSAPRWIRPALYVSVALNLLILGIFAGAVLSGARGVDRLPRSVTLNLGVYTEALSEADRRALRRDFLRAGPIEPGRGDLRDSYAALLEALRAEPFDEDAAAAALSTQIAVAGARLDRAQQLMLGRFRQMAPAERAAFADRLEAQLRGVRQRITRPGG